MNRALGKVIAFMVIGSLGLGAMSWTIGASRPDRPEEVEGLSVFAEDPDSVYDPVRAGEPLPDGYRKVLGRDDILPVYDPVADPGFVTAEATDWPEDSLVVGLEIGGEARAYPVAFLNRREMVLDSIAGIPVLVTW